MSLGRFGKYQLIDRLSAGGMGELFRAQLLGPGGFARAVALKRIRPTASSDRKFVEMFVEEAKISSLLAHQNLVRLYDFGSEGGILYLAMELVEGRDLHQVLLRCRSRRESFPPPVALRIAQQVALGLDHLHRLQKDGQPLQLVHRDVSPHNVLVSFSGEVKLSDFGIVQMRRRQRLTEAGLVKGKLGYLSPEQLKDLPLDGRSDLFGLGIVLWECLTGARLFPASRDLAMIRQLLKRPIRPPSTFNDQVEAAVDGLVLRLLRRQPEQRFADAGAAAAAIAALGDRVASDAQVAATLRRLYPEATLEAPRGEEVTEILDAPLPWLAGDGTPATLEPAVEPKPTAVTLAPLPNNLAQPPPPAFRAGGWLKVGALAGCAVATATLGGALWHRVGGERRAAVQTSEGAMATAGGLSGADAPSPRWPKSGAPRHEAAANAAPIPPDLAAPNAGVPPGRSPPSPAPTLAVFGASAAGASAAGASAAGASVGVSGAASALSATPAAGSPMPATAAAAALSDIHAALDSPTGAALHARPPPTARLLAIAVHPWAEVLVDGRSLGFTPLRTKLSAGTHAVRLLNPAAGIARGFQLELAPGDAVRFSGELRDLQPQIAR